jgi:hypothetical protein
VPWQEFVQAQDGMIGDVCEHVGGPGARVHVVQLGRDDERITSVNVVEFAVGLRWPGIMRLRW